MTHKSHPLVSEIRDRLAEAADPERAKSAQAYMKSEMPFRGMPAKEFRQIVRDANKKHPLKNFLEFENVVRDLWEKAACREERHAAVELCTRYKKFQILEALPFYRRMIETGAWWDFVDAIAANLIGMLLKNQPRQMKKTLYEWIENENLWLRRTAILAQLKFKENTDEQMLFEFCQRQLRDSSFWIRKAIGWALRQYSKTNPDSVRQFVEKYRSKMSGVSLREALKYL